LRRVEPSEGEQPRPCFFKAVGHHPTLEPPLAEERLAAALHLRCGVGADHVPVVLSQLVLHVLRGVGQEIAVVANRAALDRQVAAPQRNERGFEVKVDRAVQPRFDHGAVEDQADDVLIGQTAGAPRASRSTFTWREPRLTFAMGLEPRAHNGSPLLTAPSNLLNSARFTRRVLVPARQTAAIRASAFAGKTPHRGVSFSCPVGQPLVTGQRLRAPFRHLARLVLDPGARHPQRLGPEGAGEWPFAVPVAIAFRGTLAPGRSEAGRESRPVPPRTRPP
jgi:hypothetical protein